MNLSKRIKVDLVKDTQTTAGTAVNSDEVDMSGWDGVIFFMKMTTANAANFINAAQSSVSGGTFVDLAGTKVVPGDDGDIGLLDIYRPVDRYVRLEVDRGGADTVTGEIYAIQYRESKAPTTHAAEVDSELHVSPAEGTA